MSRLPFFRDDGSMRYSYLYLLECRDDGGPTYVKIGVTMNPGSRLSGILVGCPIKARSFAIREVGWRDVARKIERNLHRAFEDRRVQGEWFKIDLTSPEDKAIFHDALAQAIHDHKGHKNGVWSTISVPKYQELERQRRARWARMSKTQIRRKAMIARWKSGAA